MAGHPRRLLVLLMILVVTGTLLGSPTPVLAHVRPAPATPAVAEEPASALAPSVTSIALPVVAPGVAAVRVVPIQPPWPAAPISAALILALLLGATLIAPRRVLITVLVLVLAVIAVEESVHSVHHLADQRGAAHCAVAAASAHVQGAAEPLAVPQVWVPTPIGAVIAAETKQPGSRPLRPDEGRAPPSA